jgi:hypothetical protein
LALRLFLVAILGPAVPLAQVSAQQPQPASAQPAEPVAAPAFKPAELDQLLAPIALYPDELVAQILTASTYPLEIVMAGRWVADPKNAALKGDALVKELDKVLTAQGPDVPGGAADYIVNGRMIGGFGLVAWPARYDDSGVMTFMVNHEGVVYQKDLGPQTAKLAPAITRFDPGPGWQKTVP